MTAAEARDPVKALSQLKATAGEKCKTMNVRESGNTLTFDMDCGDPKIMSIAINAEFHLSEFAPLHRHDHIESRVRRQDHDLRQADRCEMDRRL